MKVKRLETLSWMSALLGAALVIVAFAQRSVAADYDPSGRVARLNYLRGSISFQPAGEPDWVSAIVNRPITTGDRLWADQGSRAELHLGSAAIRMDAMTGMSFLNLDDRITQIELSEGTLNVRVVRMDRDEIFEVDTPNQAFSILRPGAYRIQASEDGNFTMVTVRAGEGEATGGGRTYTVRAGQSGNFTGNDSLRAAIFNAGGYDEFDRWSQDRDNRDDRSLSARYVSPYLVGYQDLDDYGYWRSDRTYGNVWIPRVNAGWAPYRDGYWSWISPWGWTWVDYAPWGYAPFHYGRWAYLGSDWGWIPGPIAVRPIYAPALVAFIGGPRFSFSISVGGGGLVGWFPLGPREVYVPAYRTSRDYVDRVNITNTTVNNITITNVYNNTSGSNLRYQNRDVRGGVTAVSQNTFANAQPVNRAVVAVNPQQIASAPVNRRAEVTPNRTSVLGNEQRGGRVAQPPAAIANRAVVAKTTPPPSPVPFARQQQRLAAQPGQPLAGNDIEALRPAGGQQRVRQAPPGRAATPDSNQPIAGPAPAVNSPATNGPPARNDRPNGNGNGNANRGQRPQDAQPPSVSPAAPPVVNPPVTNGPPARNDRPNGNGNANRGQRPQDAQPPTVIPAAPPVVNPPVTNGPPVRNDRPNGNGNANRGQRPQDAQPPTVTPATPPVVNPPVTNGPPVRNDRPNNGANANRGQQQQNAQPPDAAPAPAQTNPPVTSTPPIRNDRPDRGNRGQRPQAAPAPDAAPAPTGQNPNGRNRGQQRQETAPAPQQPPVSNAPSAQPPAQAPATATAAPASSNAERGNRGNGKNQK